MTDDEMTEMETILQVMTERLMQTGCTAAVAMAVRDGAHVSCFDGDEKQCGDLAMRFLLDDWDTP